jgi:curved DNA-binding protein CbpA
MKPDPYTTLGVPKDADADVIRKAHRSRAKKTHPDVNGNADEFRKVNAAYMVLRDPERRKRFDETGEAEPPKNTAETDLIKLFIMTVEQMPDAPVNPTNIVGGIIEQNMNRMQEDIRGATHLAAKLIKAARKINRKRGENMISIALTNRAEQETTKITILKASIERGHQMLAMLKEYEYEMPPTPPKPTFQSMVNDYNNFLKFT